ncbi:hypothetical protein V8C42DRAFT_322715 [Trichoderma barbatum]
MLSHGGKMELGLAFNAVRLFVPFSLLLFSIFASLPCKQNWGGPRRLFHMKSAYYSRSFGTTFRQSHISLASNLG